MALGDLKMTGVFGVYGLIGFQIYRLCLGTCVRSRSGMTGLASTMPDDDPKKKSRPQRQCILLVRV